MLCKKLIHKWKITENHFKIVIDHEECDLTLFLLKINHCITILNDRSIQSFVFNNYMRYGSKMYYGAETLSYMYIIFWSSELTK